MARERLQKIIAQAGVASRRAAERLIVNGRVRINGHVAKALGTKADPQTEHVEIDGLGILTAEPLVYMMLNKPPHVLSTIDDPAGRPTVMTVIEQSRALGPKQYEGMLPRVYPVGRLDFDAEGLILLSNDGPLTHRLLHPKCHVPKTYVVKTKGKPSPAAVKRLQTGVKIYDDTGDLAYVTRPADVAPLHTQGPMNGWLKMTLHEGRNHQVKRMCGAVGFPVLRLVRTDFAGLAVDSLPTGAWRFLSPAEVGLLKGWRL